jgi:hypothetical protein
MTMQAKDEPKEEWRYDRSQRRRKAAPRDAGEGRGLA